MRSAGTRVNPMVSYRWTAPGSLVLLPRKRRVAPRASPLSSPPRSAGELAYRRNQQPCTEAGYEPDIVQEGSTWTTILALVGAGLGVTIAPESAAAAAPPQTRILPLTGTDARSQVQFVRHRADRRAIVSNFVDAVEPKTGPLDE